MCTYVNASVNFTVKVLLSSHEVDDKFYALYRLEIKEIFTTRDLIGTEITTPARNRNIKPLSFVRNKICALTSQARREIRPNDQQTR